MAAVEFLQRGELTLIQVHNDQASASISLQGGQLLAWQPRSQAQPVIWLSRRAQFAQGKAIRGGIPLCWPWFGAHPQDAGLPAHGYARILPWQLLTKRKVAGGATEIVLALDPEEAQSRGWTAPLRAALTLTIGEALQLALTTHNLGADACVVSEALHSYFQVGDVAAVRVRGLEGCQFVDKVAQGARRRQAGALGFSGEVDRVYLATEASCLIEDEGLQRRIRIDKSGSASTVVWSPWADKAGKLPDLGAEGWRDMVCVETANALDDALRLAAGASHTLSMRCTVEAL